MTKHLTTLLLVCLCMIPTWARNVFITGQVHDKSEGGKPLQGASVILLKSDSTFLTGQVTPTEGSFSLKASKEGKYIIEVAFVGYATVWRDIEIPEKTDSINLGSITLAPRDITLGAATIRATAAKIMQSKDTIVFNAAAFRTMEGATLKKLVEQLPGVEVDDDGAITVNGKSVNEIKINGKDFFKGDTKMAMDNLPVTLVDKVKTYEEKSDYTKYTGIEDGNKKTVLDIKLKKELKSTLTTNGNVSGGTNSRYRDEIFLNRFTDLTRQTFFGNLSNLQGWGWGLHSNKNFGTNLQWMNKEDWKAPGRYEINAGLNYTHGNDDVSTTSNSETYLGNSQTKSFSNSKSQGYNHNSTYNANAGFRWNIDSLTYVYGNGTLSFNNGTGYDTNRSVTWNQDPYQQEAISDPLEAIFADNPSPELLQKAVNRKDVQSQSNSHGASGNMDFGMFHRLDTLGQNISIQGGFSLNHSRARDYYMSDLAFYQEADSLPQTFYDQYIHTPSNSFSIHGKADYVYAFNKKLHLTTGYGFSYSYNNHEKNWYELDSLASYQVYNHPKLGTIPEGDSLALAFCMENSQYSTYHEYEHTISLGLNYAIENKLNLTFDMDFRPHHTRLNYRKGDFDKTLYRNTFSFVPRLHFRYEFSNTHTFDFNYHADTNHPSMLNLIDIPDNSNPLYITHGNKDLKSAWSNNIDISYNKYNTERQQSFGIYQTFNQVSNSISNTITYQPETGGQIVRPENINGNWNEATNIHFHQSFGKDNRYQVFFWNRTNYSHQVGYVNLGKELAMANVKNTVNSVNMIQAIGGGYRLTNFDCHLSLNYRLQYSHASRQENADMHVHGWGCRARLNYRMPWHMQIGSGLRVNLRRGYDDPQLNTNEYMWDIDLTQALLKDDKLSVGFEAHDILHSRKNISHSISATGWSDTRTNSIGTYCLFKVVYKFNIFGGDRNKE